VSDLLIDLGPEGGDEGGQVIVQGTPEQVATAAGSHTGEFLAAMLPVKASRGGRTPRKSGGGSNGSAKTTAKSNDSARSANGSSGAANGDGHPSRRRRAATSSR
jgi:hypothetical protein